MKSPKFIASLVVLATLLAAQQRARARGCLAADTPILTPGGLVAVQNLKVGDDVFSITEGSLHSAKVRARFEVIADEMLEIRAGGRILNVTPEHPMQIAAGVFVEAGKLRPGDHLWLWNGQSLQAVSIDSIQSNHVHAPAHNILVSPGGTYLADGIAVHNKGCFLPDTPVMKADGTESPIAEIRPGDRLRAFTPEGEIVTANVQNIVTHEVDEYCHVTTDSIALDVTAEHPFFVGNGTFKTIEALKVGDLIYAFDGRGLSSQKITAITRIARHVTVYNLQTDEPHTFFAHGVAVHNKGGGGGGHGGGGHSFGSSSHGYSSYGHGSSTQPFGDISGIICPFSIILILLLTFVYRIFHHQATSSSSSSFSLGQNLDYVSPRSAIDPKAAQTTKLLDHLSQSDGQIAPGKLHELVQAAFVQLQKCWELRNYTPMQSLLMADLYRSHSMQLAAMVRQHEINHISGLVIDRIDLVNVRYTQKPEQREFTALITATARDYYTDDRTGKFIRGDQSAAQFQEFWIFHFVNGRWLLREIEQSRESDALRAFNFVEQMSDQQMQEIGGKVPALVPNKVSRVDGLLDTLAKKDPTWDKAGLMSRARDVYVTMMLAFETGDTTQAAGECLPDGLTKVKDKCALLRREGMSVEYRNLCVRKVDVVLVQNKASKEQSEFTARINSHAQEVCTKGGAVVAQDDAELPMVQYLSFGWGGDKWRLKDILSAAQGSLAMN